MVNMVYGHVSFHVDHSKSSRLSKTKLNEFYIHTNIFYLPLFYNSTYYSTTTPVTTSTTLTTATTVKQ
jgi:hypothetical protein